LGKERATLFSAALAKSGIVLDARKTWTRWRATNGKLDLAQFDATAIAEAVRETLVAGVSPKTGAATSVL